MSIFDVGRTHSLPVRKWKLLFVNFCELKNPISISTEFLNSCLGRTDASLLWDCAVETTMRVWNEGSTHNFVLTCLVLRHRVLVMSFLLGSSHTPVGVVVEK